jgi:hypothetical protein
LLKIFKAHHPCVYAGSRTFFNDGALFTCIFPLRSGRSAVKVSSPHGAPRDGRLNPLNQKTTLPGIRRATKLMIITVTPYAQQSIAHVDASRGICAPLKAYSTPVERVALQTARHGPELAYCEAATVMIGANPNADTDDVLDALTALARGGATDLREARLIYEAMGYQCARVFDKLAVTNGARTWEVLEDLTLAPVTGTIPPAARTIFNSYHQQWQQRRAALRKAIDEAYKGAMDDAQKESTPEDATQQDNAVAVATGLSDVVSQVEGQCDPDEPNNEAQPSATDDTPDESKDDAESETIETNDIDENDAN